MKRIGTLIAAAAAVIIFQSASLAHETQYSAVLSGPAEAPPNASPGTGTALITFDFDLNTMRMQVEFSGLVGTTTASHIHASTTVPGVGTAIVATQTPTFADFPLGVTSGTYDHTFDMTVASSYNPAYITANGGTLGAAEPVFINALGNGTAYLNIHTSAVPSGEIRGFLQVVPEPSSMGLIGLALPLMVRRSRRC